MTNIETAAYKPSRETGPAIHSIVQIEEGHFLNHNSNAETALIFITTYCSKCIEFISLLSELKLQNDMNFTLFVAGNTYEENEFMKQHFVWDFPVVALSIPDMKKAYQVEFTPFTIILNENNEVMSKGITESKEQFDFLITTRRFAL